MGAALSDDRCDSGMNSEPSSELSLVQLDSALPTGQQVVADHRSESSRPSRIRKPTQFLRSTDLYENTIFRFPKFVPDSSCDVDAEMKGEVCDDAAPVKSSLKTAPVQHSMEVKSQRRRRRTPSPNGHADQDQANSNKRYRDSAQASSSSNAASSHSQPPSLSPSVAARMGLRQTVNHKFFPRQPASALQNGSSNSHHGSRHLSHLSLRHVSLAHRGVDAPMPPPASRRPAIPARPASSQGSHFPVNVSSKLMSNRSNASVSNGSDSSSAHRKGGSNKSAPRPNPDVSNKSKDPVNSNRNGVVGKKESEKEKDRDPKDKDGKTNKREPVAGNEGDGSKEDETGSTASSAASVVVAKPHRKDWGLQEVDAVGRTRPPFASTLLFHGALQPGIRPDGLPAAPGHWVIKRWSGGKSARRRAEIEVHEKIRSHPHRNLVEILSVHPVDGVLMEYCRDGDLQTQMATGRRTYTPLPTIVAQFRGMMEGLCHLHLRLDIVHSDISPRNIFLRKSECVLGDFGHSYLVGRHEPTRSSVAMQGASFVAPEVERGDVSTKASDVFSCGRILAEMLAAAAQFSEYHSEQRSLGRILGSIADSMCRADPQARVTVRGVMKRLDRLAIRERRAPPPT